MAQVLGCKKRGKVDFFGVSGVCLFEHKSGFTRFQTNDNATNYQSVAAGFPEIPGK